MSEPLHEPGAVSTDWNAVETVVPKPSPAALDRRRPRASNRLSEMRPAVAAAVARPAASQRNVLSGLLAPRSIVCSVSRPLGVKDSSDRDVSTPAASLVSIFFGLPHPSKPE